MLDLYCKADLDILEIIEEFGFIHPRKMAELIP